MLLDDAYELVRALKQALKIPVNLHSHFTSGMACMSILKATEAGVDFIDTCIAPFALRTSHPAIEPLVVALQGSPRDTGLKPAATAQTRASILNLLLLNTVTSWIRPRCRLSIPVYSGIRFREECSPIW